jgi:hypothetical protein
VRDLIRDALAHQARGECPDAALLAAYADRTLDRVARESVAAHLADCDRCRETLILMTRAAAADQPAEYAEYAEHQTAEHEPAEAAEYAEDEDRRFILRRWPWVAGAAAAAALAVVMWTSVHQRGSVSLPSVAPTAKPSPMVFPESREKPAGVAQEERRRQDQAATQNKAERVLADRAEKAPPPQARPGAKSGLPQVAQPATAAETVTMAETTAAARPPTVGQAASRAEPRRAAESAPAALRSAALITATAPDGRTVWRTREPGTIERSTDAGVTWTRESGIEAPGARAMASPSVDVCWIVGQAGLILHYETARGWMRVRAPAAVDLVAVTAVDARQATVTAADGRRFSTADGGESWTRFE